MARKIAEPEVLTKRQVIERLQEYVDNFNSQREAADAMGVTQQALSSMLKDRIPLRPAALDALGLGRAQLYTTAEVHGRYLDGVLHDDL